MEENDSPSSPSASARRSLVAGALRPALEAPGYPGWLLVGVLGVIAYAAFANGATAVTDESHVQLALAAAAGVSGVGIARGGLGAARSPLAWAAVGLIAAFTLFGALSVQWSLAPDQSWSAANRAAEYVAVLAIVLVAAPSVVRAPEKALGAFLALAMVVALYALGGKLFPTLSVGPVDLDHASQFSRLRAPLGYWNALGMLLVMAVPACLWLAADPERPRGLRLGAVLSLELLLVTIALTYSRGALFALAVAIGVMAFCSEQRARSVGAAALALVAAAVPVGVAFSRDKLSRDGVPAADRVGDGVVLALALAASLLVLAVVALWILRAEPALEFSERRRQGLRRLRRLLGAAAAVVVILALAASPRGLTGTLSHEWEQFRQPVGISNDPDRLLSANGSNRWIWWREAAGAFSDRPLAGWGAGSFPIVHSQYREYETQVRSAHSVPLQFLAEGGLVGALLALGGVGLLFAAAVKTVRTPKVVDRNARIALIAAGAAWMAHCLVDWDWEIPAVTLPALAALAIAAAPWREGRRWLDPNPPSDRRRRLNEVLALPVGAAAIVLGLAFAFSAELPALAEQKRVEALTRAGEAAPGDEGALADAIDEAGAAHDLNPLDEDVLFTAAALEQRAENLPAARELLLEAARIHPENYRVWDELLAFAISSGDRELAERAFERRLETEPLSYAENPELGAGTAFSFAVPAELSPTAFGTPPDIPLLPPVSPTPPSLPTPPGE